MGLFSKLPEEPVDWAGLPSEPDRPESTAERLGSGSSIDLGLLGLDAASSADAVESIVVPVQPVIEIAEAEESGEGE